MRQEESDRHEAFDKSHIGLFLGAISVSSVVVVTVISFILKGEQKNYEVNMTYYIYDTFNYAALLATCMVLYLKFRDFAVARLNVNTIDDVLLLLSVSGVFLLKFFKVFSDAVYFMNGGTNADSALDLACGILTIITALWQTVLTIDGLHLHCKNETHLAEKPGRGTIAFLIILNISIWLFKSINIKQQTRTVHENTYGSVAWPLIFNGFVPLMLFYHFHSSVMWADIWEHAYKRSEWLEFPS